MKKRRQVKRAKKVPKKAVSADALATALARRTKAELVEAILQVVRGNLGIRRELEERFQVELPPDELINATGLAICDATDFDERQINYNFDYDWRAYEAVQRNFELLVKAGHLQAAMDLSLRLMKDGSYQVEMSDEGLMTQEIEECLLVVINAVRKSNLPPADVTAWCAAMVNADRVGFVCDRALHSLQPTGNKR
jgi:hypothetical protein